MRKEKCPICGKKVEYDFCSDRWECEECNYTGLYAPSEAERYGSEREVNE